ncbi:MAG: hypothetical protein FWH43_02850, partial [Endomicrobia bacterium]|nr:hypothetical protein [Endomicrobiia bacterium]
CVTGGYHTKGLTDLLSSKNISYAVLTPNISDGGDIGAIHKNYENTALEQSGILSEGLQLTLFSQILNGEAGPEFMQFAAKLFASAAKTLENMPYSEAKVEELLQYMNEAVGENYKFERDIKFPEKITLKSADGRYSENFIEIYGRKGKISVKNIYARNTADKVFLKDSGKLLSGKETAGFLENFTKTLNIASLDFGAGVFVPKIYPAAESVFDWAAKKGLYINIDEINGIDFDAELYGLSDILLSENPDTAKLPTDLQKAKVRSYIKAEKYKGNAFYAAGLLNEMLFLDEETLARRIVLADERIEKGYLDDIVPAFKNFLGINSDEDFEEFKKKAAASSVFHENEKIRDVLKQLGFAGVKSGKIKAIEEFTPNEKLLIFEWFIGNSKDSKASVVESPVITAAAAKLRAKIAEEKKKEEEKDKKIEAADEIAEKSEAQNLFEEEVERIMKNKGKYTEGVDYVQSDDGEILPIGEKFMGKLRSAVNFATKPGTAVFYSRLKDAAAKYANKNKKQTLEMTDDGKYFDSLKIWDKFGEKASHIYWDMFSEKFAEQATGEVTLFLNNPAQTSVYIIREWPSIHLNDNISKIVIRDYGRIIGSDYGAVALGEEFFEKDGFMPDILLSGILARSGKTPSEILSEVYSKVGYVPSMEESTIEFADREERENAEKNLFDLSEPGINELIDFEALGFDAGTGASGIQIIGDMDLYEYRLRKGIKITINDSAWIVIRQAPAENALQIYVETDSKLKTKNLSDKINSMLKDGFRLDRTASQSSRKTKWYDLALISELINFGKIQDLLKYTGKKAVDVEYRYINGLENYINAYKKTGRQDLKKSNRLEVLIINQMPENPENLGFKNTGLKVNGSIVWESLTTGTLVMYARNADANDIAKAATDIMPVVLKRETGSSEFSAVAVDERREHTKAFKYLDNGMLVMTKRFYDETFRFYKNSPEAAAEKIINEQKAEKAAFGRNFIMDLSRIKRDKMQKALEAYNKSGNRQIALPLDYFEGKTEAEISSFVSEMSKNGTRVFAVIDENSSLNEFDSERLKTALLKYNFSGFLLKKDDKIISFRDYFSESENKVSEINDFADENELVNKINSSDEDSVKVIDIENYVSLADGGIRDISERIDSFVGLFGDKILKFFNGNISRDAAVKTALAFDMPVVPDNVNERALANIMDNEPSKAVNERLAGMLKVNEIPEFKIYLKRIDENAANDEERIKLKYAFLSTIAKKAKVKADLKDRQFPAGFDTKELEELMILSALSKRAADNRFISELYEAESAESRYAAVKTLAAGLNMTEGEAAAATIYQLILAFSEQRTGIRSVPSETISIESVSQILKAA